MEDLTFDEVSLDKFDPKKVEELIKKGEFTSPSFPISDTSKYDKNFIPYVGVDKDFYTQLRKHRADEQSNWAAAGNMITRGILKAGISMVEPLGYLADVEQYTTDVNKYEEEYGNWFNNALIKAEGYLDEKMPIYTNEDKPKIGTSDWFLSNGDQIIKSLGYFVPGALGAKAVGMGMKGLGILGDISKASMLAIKGDVFAKSLLPVIALNYSEHMRSAVDAFAISKDKIYEAEMDKIGPELDAQYNSGQISMAEYDSKLFAAADEARAKSKVEAADIAEGIIKKGKANLPLNMLEYTTLFKFMGGTRRLDDIAVKALSTKGAANAMLDFVKSGGGEYLEEVNTGFFEKEAEREADLKTGKIVEDENPVNRYLEHATSYEGYTEGLSGFIGGAGMQTLSNVMDYKAKNNARDIKKQIVEWSNASDDTKQQAFNNLQLSNLVDLLQKANTNGVAGTAYNTLDAISKVTKEDAVKLGLDEDYVEKATEFKEVAKVFEDTYNDLSVRNAKDPLAVNLLTNLKVNSFINKNQVSKQEKAIKDIEDGINTDIKSSPMFKAKTLDYKIAANTTLLSEIDELYKEVYKDPSARTTATNETAGELESRSELIKKNLDLLYDEKAELLNKHLKSKYTKPEKVEGKEAAPVPEYKVTKENGKHKVSLTNQDDQSIKIHENIVAEVNKPTLDETKLGLSYHELELAKSTRDNSIKMFTELSNNPQMLDQVKAKINNIAKEEVDTYKTKITSAASLTELNNLDKPNLNKELKKEVAKKRKEFESNKRKEDLAKGAEAANIKPADKPAATGVGDAITTDTEVEDTTPFNISKITSVQTPLKAEDVPTVKDFITKTPIKAGEKLTLEDLNSNETVYNAKLSLLKHELEAGGLTTEDLINKTTEREALLTEKYANDDKRRTAERTNRKLEEIVNESLVDPNATIDSKWLPYVKQAAQVAYKASPIDEVLKNVENLPDEAKAPYLKEQLQANNLKLSILNTESSLNKEVDYNNQIVATQYDISEIEAAIQTITPVEHADPASIDDTPSIVDERLRANQAMISGSEPRRIIMGNKLTRGRQANTRPSLYGYVTNPARAAAFLDRDYIESGKDISKQGRPMKHSITNENIERDDFLKSISNVDDVTLEFEIDTESEYYKKAEEKAKAAADYDSEFRDSVPIKIVAYDKQGKRHETGTHIHETDWVMNNSNEDALNNVKEVRDIRNQVLSNSKAGIKTTGFIEAIDRGHYSYNVMNEKGTLEIEKSTNKPYLKEETLAVALPTLKNIAVGKDGNLHLETSMLSAATKAFEGPTVNGGIYGIVVEPDGLELAVPLYSKPLSDKRLRTAKDGIVNSILTFYSDAPLSQKATEVTGLNKVYPSSMFKYLRDMVYVPKTKKYEGKIMNRPFIMHRGDEIVIGNAKDAGAQIGYAAGIDKEGKSYFKVYKSNEQDTAITSEQAKELFTAKVQEVVPELNLSVRLEKLNKKQRFNVPFLTKSGNISETSLSYNSYEDFLKNTLTTKFNGRTKLSNGQYTMFSQPNITFSLGTPKASQSTETQLTEEELKAKAKFDAEQAKKAEEANKQVSDIEDFEDADPAVYNIPDVQSVLGLKVESLTGRQIEEYKTTVSNQLINMAFNNAMSEKVESLDVSIKYLKRKFSARLKNLKAVRSNVEPMLLSTDVKGEGYRRLLKSLNIKTNEEAEKYIANYEDLMLNWNKIAELAISRLNTLDMVDGQFEEEYDDGNDMDVRIQYNSKLRLNVNPISYNKKFKFRLATVPVYTRNEKGEYIVVKDSLGEIRYMDPDITFNNLLELFADFEPVDNMQDLADSMINKLKESVDKNPEYQGFIEMFDSMTDVTNNNEKIANDDFKYSLKTLFVNSLSNTKVRLEKIISFKVKGPKTEDSTPRGYEDNMRYVNVPINDVSGHKGVEKAWVEMQKHIGLFKGEGDKLKINNELVNSVKQRFIDLRNSEIEKFAGKGENIQKQSKLTSKEAVVNLRESMAFVNNEYLQKFVDLLAEIGIMTDTASLFDGVYKASRAELAKLIKDVNTNGYVKSEYDTSVTEKLNVKRPTSPIGMATIVNGWMQYNTNIQPGANTIFTKLFDAMLNPNLEVTWSTDNIFYGSEVEYKFIVPLAKATYDNNDKSYSLVSLDSENNNIYEIQKYNGLMKILGQIKSGQSTLLSDLSQTSFGINHPFINELLTDADYLDALDITFHDAVTTASVDSDYGNDNNTRENLNIRNQDLNYLLSFQASKGKYGKFIGLTFGDNPITPKFVSKIYDYSYRVKTEPYIRNGVTYNRPAIGNLSADGITHIMKYAEAEMARITSATAKKNEGVEFNGSEYNKFYDKFIMFNIFNYEELAKTISKENLDIVYPNGVFSDLPESRAILRQVLTRHLTANIEGLINDYIEYGILQDNGKGMLSTRDMDLGYLKELRSKHPLLNVFHNTADTVLYKVAVSNFYMNQYIANLNMHSIFARDLVHFAKGKDGYNHNLTLAAVQKRLRPALTPWYTPRFTKPTSKIVVINDIRLSTIDDLVNKGYIDQKIADGFEWATTEDYIEYLLAYDKITKSQYDRIIGKINDSHTNGTYDYTLDKEDINAMFVLKPISYDTALNTQDDTVYNFLTKSARFALLPQITKNYPDLDKLRIFLEKNKIDRATFESSAKTKSVNTLNVFNKDGSFIDDIETEYKTNGEKYDYFQHHDMNGINSFSPYGKDKITSIIQVDRGLGATMMDNPEIAALVKRKDQIRIQQLELGKAKITKRFDAVVGDDGIIRFRNLKKLKEILEQEGHDRKWIDNSLELLSLDENNRFDLSLLHNNYLNKIQSVIFSIINKELVRHKVTGNSMVQIPDFGKPKIKILGDEGVQTHKDSIVYIDGITPGERLKFITKSNDSVVPAQVIMSWNFKDVNGNLLDINQFIDPITKRIDNNKLPPEVLRGVALRIPNQKHSSMMPFEIVGFLPSTIKDTVIVPNEIVAQMGSDFDIDKLYNYLKGYYYDSEINTVGVAERGTDFTERIKELTALQDQLISEVKSSSTFFKDITTHKRGIIITKIRTYEALLDTYGNDTLEDVADKVNKLDATLNDLEQQADLTDDKEVQKLLKEHSKLSKRLKAVSTTIESYKKATEEGMYLNNEYIQVHLDVLSKGIMYDKLTESLDMTDLADAVNDVKDVSMQDINDHRYQRNSYISQQSGKKLLGIISLHVSMHNLIEGIPNVYLLETNEELQLIPKEIKAFEVNGEVLNLSFVSGIGKYKEGHKTRTNHDIIIMLQNAAVDNANNPILGYGNINDVTIGTALMMAYLKTPDMKSLPVKYIVEFLNQPIVKEYVKVVNENMSTTNNNLNKAKEEAIESLITKYNPKLTISPTNKSYSYEDLKGMRLGTTDVIDKLNILNTISELNKYFYVIDNVRKAILAPSKEGLAQTYGQILYQEYLIEDYLKANNKDINNIQYVYKQGKEFTQSGYYTNEVVNNFAKGIAELFGYDTKEFMEFKDKAKKITAKSNIDQRFFENLISYYRRASLSFNPDVFGEPLVPLRKRLIEGDNSLAYRIEVVKDKILTDNRYRDLINNKFLRSLYNRKDINGTGFSIIKIQYGASVGIDKNANFDGLNQMLIHSEKEVRDLAIDLIKYTFVMGQPFEANYQQDISYKYLKATGMLDALKNTKINNDALFKLYIQNNPWLTYSLNLTKVLNSEIDDVTKMPTKFTIEHQPYIGYYYFKAPDNTYHLWQRVGFNKTANGTIATFVKIPTMGGVNIKGMRFLEGDFTNVNGMSAFDVNNRGVNPDLFREYGTDEWVIPNPNLQLPNKNSSFSIDYLNGLEVENISNVLNNITDSKYTELASILSKILGDNSNITVTEDTTINSKGTYKNGKIKINTDIIKQNKVNINSVILHETIHGVLSDIISKYKNKQFDKLTSTQREALDRLEKIRTDLKFKVELQDGFTEQIKDYNTKYAKLKNKESVAFTPVELFYYDLNSLDEFVTGVLTRESTQMMLDSIQYSESKSILDKIKDYIKAIVVNFIKSAGIKITDGMALEASITSVMDVLQSVNTESSITNEFTIADKLPPIEQNFTDGQGGRTMQHQFKGKSTMDLIKSGDRSRTTRAKTDINRMIKDYSLTKIEDLVGKVIRMTDRKGNQVYTRITNVAKFTQSYQDQTWQKEGWIKDVTDRHVGDYPYAIEFEVIDKNIQTNNLNLSEVTKPTNSQLSLFNDPNQQFDILANTNRIDIVFEQNPDFFNTIYNYLGYNTTKLSYQEIEDIVYSNHRPLLFPDLKSIYLNSARLKGFNISSEKASINFLNRILKEAKKGEELRGGYDDIRELIEAAIDSIYREDYNKATQLGERALSLLHDDVSRYLIHEGIENMSDLSISFATHEQKQQVKYLYSRYLDTIFPDSKVKDIVYHGTDFDFLKSGEATWDSIGGFHFGTLKAAQDRINDRLEQTRADEELGFAPKEGVSLYGNGHIYAAILNATALDGTVDQGHAQNWAKYINEIKEGNWDSIEYINNQEDKGSNSYVVFEPEQIHILGSKQDMQMFKDFINNTTTIDYSDNAFNNC